LRGSFREEASISSGTLYLIFALFSGLILVKPESYHAICLEGLLILLSFEYKQNIFSMLLKQEIILRIYEQITIGMSVFRHTGQKNSPSYQLHEVLKYYKPL